MTTFTFTQNVKKENNGKVNLIIKDADGYRLQTINGRFETNEMQDKLNYKYYSSVEELIEKSEQFQKFQSFNTFEVVRKGTDMANAKLVKVELSNEKALSITTATFYNNSVAKLNINLSNGKTMCANVLNADKIKYINNEVSIDELCDKYFILGDFSCKYANPKQ